MKGLSQVSISILFIKCKQWMDHHFACTYYGMENDVQKIGKLDCLADAHVTIQKIKKMQRVQRVQRLKSIDLPLLSFLFFHVFFLCTMTQQISYAEPSNQNPISKPQKISPQAHSPQAHSPQAISPQATLPQGEKHSTPSTISASQAKSPIFKAEPQHIQQWQTWTRDLSQWIQLCVRRKERREKMFHGCRGRLWAIQGHWALLRTQHTIINHGLQLPKLNLQDWSLDNKNQIIQFSELEQIWRLAFARRRICWQKGSRGSFCQLFWRLGFRV